MKKEHSPLTDRQIAMRVSSNSIMANAVLTVAKLTAGIIAHSGAMISDAVHSASDVFSTVIVMIGVSISSKASDKEHQYGHERIECVAGILLACILFATGVGIGYSGFTKILTTSPANLEVPGVLALIAAVASIITKEFMYWYTRHAARKINSSALMADAWHHRSDSLSSIGSLAGIAGARMGFPILDPIASIIICLFIIKASYDIFMDSVNKMVDKSCDEETLAKIRELILCQPGVLGIDDIKTRIFGSKLYIDVEAAADGSKSLFEAHDIAEQIHLEMERVFPSVKHCMVHLNPVSVNKEEE